MHRDLKPENLILRSKSDDLDIVIADFGLADYYNPDCDYLFKRCGTPGFAAPEILGNMNYDYKIDVFSVGVIMFILYFLFLVKKKKRLFGVSPFKADNYEKVVALNF